MMTRSSLKSCSFLLFNFLDSFPQTTVGISNMANMILMNKLANQSEVLTSEEKHVYKLNFLKLFPWTIIMIL